MEKHLCYEYETYKITCFMEGIKPVSFKKWSNSNSCSKRKSK